MVKASSTSVPGGRLSSRGAARRAQILEAATALLLEEGHAGFSVRGVAARAGVGLSHVQYYFPDPADIIAALLDRFVAQYADNVLARFRSGSGQPHARLVNALDFLLNDEAYRNACAVFMLEVSAFAVRDRKIHEAVERYYEVYLGAVDTIAGEINPSLSATQRAIRSRQCIALIEGMAATRRYLGPDAARAFSAKAAASAIEQLLA
jgi:AcrR family transcriptional regulator